MLTFFSSQSPESLSKGIRLKLIIHWVVITATYFLVASYLIYLSRNQINPDGIALIQIARHYAAGSTELAVNSYWGPLLSWILVPLLWFDFNPQLAVKILNLFFGLGFGFGCVALVKAMPSVGFIKNQAIFVFTVALVLAINMIADVITADILFSCLLTWYFAFSIRIIKSTSKIFPFVSGLLGGFAFLAKSFAFPFITIHLLTTILLKKIAIKQKVTSGSVLLPLILSFSVFILVILPWVTIISLHDGTLTIGSSGKFTSSMMRERAETGDFESIHQLFNVREGRITIWENPLEIPESSLFRISENPWNSLLYRFNVIRTNISVSFAIIKEIDLFGFYISGLVLTILILPIVKRILPQDYLLLLWGCVSIFIFMGGYILVYVEQRYFWPIHGLLLTVIVHNISLLYSSEKTKLITDYFFEDTKKNQSHRFITLFMIFVVLSTGWQTLNIIYKWRDPNGLAMQINWLRQMASVSIVKPQIISNRWYEGLYFSFWRSVKFLGKFKGTTPEAIATELQPFSGATSVIIFYDENLSYMLSKNPNFTMIKTPGFSTGVLSIFSFNNNAKFIN